MLANLAGTGQAVPPRPRTVWDAPAGFCKQAVNCSNVRSAAGLVGDKLRDNHPGQRRTFGHTPRYLVVAGFQPGLARTLDAAFGTKRCTGQPRSQFLSHSSAYSELHMGTWTTIKAGRRRC
jgi:hypothetical protein